MPRKSVPKRKCQRRRIVRKNTNVRKVSVPTWAELRSFLMKQGIGSDAKKYQAGFGPVRLIKPIDWKLPYRVPMTVRLPLDRASHPLLCGSRIY